MCQISTISRSSSLSLSLSLPPSYRKQDPHLPSNVSTISPNFRRSIHIPPPKALPANNPASNLAPVVSAWMAQKFKAFFALMVERFLDGSKDAFKYVFKSSTLSFLNTFIKCLFLFYLALLYLALYLALLVGVLEAMAAKEILGAALLGVLEEMAAKEILGAALLGLLEAKEILGTALLESMAAKEILGATLLAVLEAMGVLEVMAKFGVGRKFCNLGLMWLNLIGVGGRS